MRHFRKFERVPTIALMLSLSLFLGLSGWQVARMQWKAGVLAKVEAAQELPALTTLPEGEAAQREAEFRKIKLTGRFIPEKSLFMGGRFRGGESGYFLLTPLKLKDESRVVLVNRGFIALGMRPTFEKMKSNLREFTVEGLIRLPRRHRSFMPENHPAQNVWFWEDLPAMEDKTRLPLQFVIVEATRTEESKEYPIPSQGKITIRNDHLGYALTWLALAVVAVVMFLAYHRKPKGSA